MSNTDLLKPLIGARCDKCRNLAVAELSCQLCGKTYRRCEKHGGEKGCRRSIHSHSGLYHPGAGRQW